MFYMICAEDNDNSLALRLSVRDKHLSRLTVLTEQNRLLIAGPFPAIDSEEPSDAGFTGSLIVASFNNLAEAQQWADEDPYIAAGVYKNVVVKPFKKVLPV